MEKGAVIDAHRGSAAPTPGAGHFLGLLLLLVVVIAAAIAFLTTVGLLQPARFLPFGAELADMLHVDAFPLYGRPLVAGGSLLVGLLAAALLLRGLVPGSRPMVRHVLSADERGVVLIEKRGVATVAETAVRRVGGVVRSQVQVRGAGAAPVELEVRAAVHAGVDLKRAGEELKRRAAEAVEELVGLQVRDVNVLVEIVPLDQLDRIVL